MDKINRIQNRTEEDNHKQRGATCTKERFLQHPGPGRAFKGLEACETVLQERFDWR